MEKQGKANLPEPLIDEVLSTQEEAIKSLVTSLELPFSVPDVVPICILWPKNIA